jgi:hypothetical protein
MRSLRDRVPTRPITDDLIQEQLAPLIEERETLQLSMQHYQQAIDRNERRQADVRGATALVSRNLGAFDCDELNESSCVIQLLRGIRQVILNLVVQVSNCVLLRELNQLISLGRNGSRVATRSISTRPALEESGGGLESR